MKTRYLFAGLLVSLMAAYVSAEQAKGPTTSAMKVTKGISYVPLKLDKRIDPLQTLDVYTRGTATDRPVIIYIHGGGWAFGDKSDVHGKPEFFTRSGFAFVSMNYRLRWDYKVYDQLTDVVAVIRWVQRNAAEYGLDGSRIVLMGHAAGGHLASLVGTDPGFLKAENVDPKTIRAVVSIDSNSYDINLLMSDLGNFIERRQHELIFSSDTSVWAAASPVTHVSRNKSLPAFALMYNPEREVSVQQARQFARALSQAKAKIIMIPGSEVDPDKNDELLGRNDHIPTGALMAFLRSQT